MTRLKRKSKNSTKRNKSKYNLKSTDDITYNFNSAFLEVRPMPVITSLDYSEFDHNFGVEDTQTIYYKV